MKKPLLAVSGGNPRLPVEDNTSFYEKGSTLLNGGVSFQHLEKPLDVGVVQQNLDTTFLDAAAAKNLIIKNDNSFWQWLGHAGKELLQAVVDELGDMPTYLEEAEPQYYRPKAFKEYQAPSRSRNSQVTYHRTGPFSAELFNQIMREANQNNSPVENINLSFVKAPPSASRQNQDPTIMGQNSNYYSGNFTPTSTGNYSQVLGFSDPSMMNYLLNNNYDAQLERAQVLENLRIQEIRQQQILRAMAQSTGQQAAQNALLANKLRPQGVKNYRPRTLRDIYSEIDREISRMWAHPDYQMNLSPEARGLMRRAQDDIKRRNEAIYRSENTPSVLLPFALSTFVGPKAIQGLGLAGEATYYAIKNRESLLETIKRPPDKVITGETNTIIRRQLRESGCTDAQINAVQRSYENNPENLIDIRQWDFKNGDRTFQIVGKGKDGRSDIIFNRRIQPDGKMPIGFKESFDYKKGYQGRITNGNPKSGLIRPEGLSRKEGESFYYPKEQKAQFHEDVRTVERQWGK